MSEETQGFGDDRERRGDTDRRATGGDRRSGEDRRKENRGIRNAPFFRLFLDRRGGTDRRSGTDRRGGGDRRQTSAPPPEDPGSKGL